MRFVAEVEFPPEPFSTYASGGTAAERIGEVLVAIKPEAVYFTGKGIGRSAVMVLELDGTDRAAQLWN